MTCVECDRRQRLVEQAEGALKAGMRVFKDLANMTYSQIAFAEREAEPLKQQLTTARSNLTRHRNKCGARP